MATTVLKDAERLINAREVAFEQVGLGDRIAEVLANEIIQGTIPGATKLNEEALAQRFGTSRTPVREALRRLAQEHLVEGVSRVGFTVTQITPRSAANIYLCRAYLHSLAARQATIVASEAEVDELGVIVREMRRAADMGDIPGVFRQNVAFHERLGEIARNEILGTILHGLGRVILRLRYMSISVPGRADASVAAHERIVEAFRARDAARAEELVRQNIVAAGEAILRHYFADELQRDSSAMREYEAFVTRHRTAGFGARAPSSNTEGDRSGGFPISL